MDISREWTTFALDAEVEAFGTARLCKAHNAEIAALRAEVARLKDELVGVENFGNNEVAANAALRARLREAEAAREKAERNAIIAFKAWSLSEVEINDEIYRELSAYVAAHSEASDAEA